MNDSLKQIREESEKKLDIEVYSIVNFCYNSIPYLFLTCLNAYNR